MELAPDYPLSFMIAADSSTTSSTSAWEHKVPVDDASRRTRPADRQLSGVGMNSARSLAIDCEQIFESHSTSKSGSLDAPVDDLYSATYEWLMRFRDFCRTCGGFNVL